MPWVSQAVLDAMLDELRAARTANAALVETLVQVTARAETTLETAQARRAVRLSREESEGVEFPEEVAKAAAYYAAGDPAEEAATLQAAREWLDAGVPVSEVIARVARGPGAGMAVVS